jgi:P27 family predicted phage terminase small subunit
MARPRKPTALKLVEGNRGKRAVNAKEPEPNLLQDLEPPARLPDTVKVVWRELAPKLRRAMVLTELDTDLLEMTCASIANYRLSVEKTAEGKLMQKNAETGAISMSPWLIIQSMTFKQGMAALREWGATPAARSRVMVDPQQDLFSATADGPGRFFG